MTTNPYAAPKAAVADETVVLDADYVSGGQSRPAGHGWSWIGEGWELFKRQPGLWIGMMLLTIIIFMGASLIPLLGMFTGIFWPVFMAGVVIGCRVLHEGGELELGHLFAGFQQRFGTLVSVGALAFLASLVVVLVVFGVMGFGMLSAMSSTDPQVLMGMGLTMLLAVLIVTALLLPVMMALWFAPALVVFHDLGAWESMKESFFGCLKNIVPFLVYSVIVVILGLLALIPLGLGLLVLWPVIAASLYTSYRDVYLKPKG
jgi:hypothetical protein